MKEKTLYRILAGCALFVSVMNGWWTLAVVVGVLCIWVYPHYFEAVAAGIMYDALFGVSLHMGMWGYAGTVLSVLSLCLIFLLKKVVRE